MAHHSESPAEVWQGIQRIKQIPAIAALSSRVIIYTKGPESSSATNLEALRRRCHADILRRLPSRGCESVTYLTHMVDHYDNLATHTLFAQVFFDPPSLSEQRLSTHLTPNAGVLSLNNYTTLKRKVYILYEMFWIQCRISFMTILLIIMI